MVKEIVIFPLEVYSQQLKWEIYLDGWRLASLSLFLEESFCNKLMNFGRVDVTPGDISTGEFILSNR